MFSTKFLVVTNRAGGFKANDQWYARNRTLLSSLNFCFPMWNLRCGVEHINKNETECDKQNNPSRNNVWWNEKRDLKLCAGWGVEIFETFCNRKQRMIKSETCINWPSHNPQLWSFTMIRIRIMRFFHQSATLIWDCLISGKKPHGLHGLFLGLKNIMS